MPSKRFLMILPETTTQLMILQKSKHFNDHSPISKYHMHSGTSSELSPRDNSDETP